jgi:hypothetical protein
MASSDIDLRELTADEINMVSGGVVPWPGSHGPSFEAPGWLKSLSIRALLWAIGL